VCIGLVPPNILAIALCAVACVCNLVSLFTIFSGCLVVFIFRTFFIFLEIS
jgi:hypothetical protein